MLISVVTVSLNSANTIEQTILSVSEQTYKNIEHIVIDGGSSDGTQDILRKSASLIRYVVEPDEGIYDAMNKGLSIARGDIIHILNADDYYASSDVCESVVSLFKKDKKLSMVSGMMLKKNPFKKNSTAYLERCKHVGLFSAFMSPFNHPTCFVRASVYHEIGVFSRQYRTASDYDFLLRFLRKGLHYKCVKKIFVVFATTGATSQSIYSPWGDLNKILRENGVSVTVRVFALMYRFVRQSLAFSIKKILVEVFDR